LPDATIPRRTEALLSWTQPLLARQEGLSREYATVFPLGMTLSLRQFGRLTA